ncbi:hypothetical protein C8F04DRAFT_1074953 [Mycena alexandri]|uniref:Uncharacterized protein n=1 Tax=Mycena alexandri TaxID=1745969 RepID=A0AAD6XC11_9AGAR|nr:hypothetical protein C8F04DRAFT_1074953 [Mycena alexandri]
MQLRRFWALGLAPVLTKGILSGPDPAPAARFAAAVLILACWRAVVSARPPVTSACGAYVWYSGVFEDGPAWGAVELADALDKTAAFPRENWNVGALIAQHGQGAAGEYVPVECYQMLAAARVHVASARGPRRNHYRSKNQPETTSGDHIRGDYTSAELNSLAREVMEEAEQTVRNHTSRINWDDYLGLAFDEWKKEADKQWASPKTEKRGPSGNKGRGKKRV